MASPEGRAWSKGFLNYRCWIESVKVVSRLGQLVSQRPVFRDCLRWWVKHHRTLKDRREKEEKGEEAFICVSATVFCQWVNGEARARGGKLEECQCGLEPLQNWSLEMEQWVGKTKWPLVHKKCALSRVSPEVFCNCKGLLFHFEYFIFSFNFRYISRE